MNDKIKSPTPYSERSPGRPLGKKDSIPRKALQKLDLRKRREFIRCLKNCGSLSRAADQVNISRTNIYALMRKDKDFARMVQEAREAANGKLEEYAYRRVIDGERIVKRDGEGNIIEVTEKPASAALVARLLDVTDTYRKDNTHIHVHQERDNTAVSKLAQALGISLEFEKARDITDIEYEEKEDG